MKPKKQIKKLKKAIKKSIKNAPDGFMKYQMWKAFNKFGFEFEKHLH